MIYLIMIHLAIGPLLTIRAHLRQAARSRTAAARLAAARSRQHRRRQDERRRRLAAASPPRGRSHIAAARSRPYRSSLGIRVAHDRSTSARPSRARTRPVRVATLARLPAGAKNERRPLPLSLPSPSPACSPPSHTLCSPVSLSLSLSLFLSYSLWKSLKFARSFMSNHKTE